MSPTSPKKSNKTDESLSSSSETKIKTSSKKDNWVSHLRGLFTSSESSNVTSPKIGKPPSPALQNNTLRRSEDQKETVMGATLDIEIDSPTTTEGTDSDLPSPRTMVCHNCFWVILHRFLEFFTRGPPLRLTYHNVPIIN